MHRHLPLALLALLLPGSAGCLVSRTLGNEPLSTEGFASLEPGRSTAADVVSALGAPADVVQLGHRSAYRYEFTQTKRASLVLIALTFSNVDTRSDRVWVFFDEDQVLTHVGATFAGDRPEYAMPWSEVHD